MKTDPKTNSPLSSRDSKKRSLYVQLPQETNLSEYEKPVLRHEAIQDASKEATKTEQLNRDRFHNLVKSSNTTLLSIGNVFPFDFFPDEISIEITQVNIIKHYFIYSAHLQTIPIKNIADVFLDTSFFFATIKIVDSSFIESSVQVEYLRKDDACKARRIIQGLITANKEGIDLTKISSKTLVQDLESLGRANDVTGVIQ